MMLFERWVSVMMVERPVHTLGWPKSTVGAFKKTRYLIKAGGLRANKVIQLFQDTALGFCRQYMSRTRASEHLMQVGDE
jgi:hypothetical protein